MGLGHWYSAYGLARSLPEYPKAELVAVAWHDRAQREEFAAAFGIKAYADYDALLKREEVDIVHISPPVAEIPECTIKAARAGKHIILGKPMAMTLQQADEMVKAVDEAGVTCVAFQGLFRLGMADLKRRLDEGLIGAIAVMHIQHCSLKYAHDRGAWGVPTGARTDRVVAGRLALDPAHDAPAAA